MLTSAVSSSAASSSAASSTSVLSSAGATSVMVTGIVVASALVAVLLFVTLLGREVVLTSDRDTSDAVRPMNTVLFAFGMAFVLNLVVESISVLG